jgi:ribose 5-phosphate isomerase A
MTKAMSADEMKRAAAEAIVPHLKTGMKLGLGTGSTARHFVDCVGELIKKGFNFTCVPTSEATKKQAESLNIPLTTLEKEPILDLTVDGADEITPELHLIKGGGGAMLREKIVATSSKQMFVIADESKKVKHLGAFPLPVEVALFGSRATAMKIERLLINLKYQGSMGARMTRENKLYITDNGNMILDLKLGKIDDPAKLDAYLASIPGVMDTGLFINVARKAFIASPKGVEIITR